LEENTAEEYNSFRPLSLILFQVAADSSYIRARQYTRPMILAFSFEKLVIPRIPALLIYAYRSIPGPVTKNQRRHKAAHIIGSECKHPFFFAIAVADVYKFNNLVEHIPQSSVIYTMDRCQISNQPDEYVKLCSGCNSLWRID